MYLLVFGSFSVDLVEIFDIIVFGADKCHPWLLGVLGKVLERSEN